MKINKRSARLVKSEIDVVKSTLSFLQIEPGIIKTEVPNLGQVVDIVKITPKEEVFCIEAKIDNWSKAIKQCLAHEIVADYIYIAVATVSISDKLYQVAKERGYGIIHCNPYTLKSQFVLQARKNKKFWQPQRTHFLKIFEGINYVN